MSDVRSKQRSSAPVTVQDQEATAVCAGVHGLLHHLRFQTPNTLSEQALVLQRPLLCFGSMEVVKNADAISAGVRSHLHVAEGHSFVGEICARRLVVVAWNVAYPRPLPGLQANPCGRPSISKEQGQSQ